MPFLGNIINFAVVLVASLLGALIRRGIPERIKTAVFYAISICVIYIGLDGALGEAPATDGFLSSDLAKFVIMLLSLVIGTLIGELIDIDRLVNRLGDRLEAKFAPKSEQSGNFAKGFVSTTIMISVGAMAVNGSILDATGNPDTLIAKATIDAIACFMVAASLGVGCAFSAFPMLLYQGSITLITLLFSSVIPDATIQYLSFTGSLIIVFIGTNFLGITKVKTANMTPAIFIPLALTPLMELTGLI